MKYTFLLSGLFFFFSLVSSAQDTISKADLKTAARMMDLQYNNAEIDSMYNGVLRNRQEIIKMHAAPLPNSVTTSMWQMPEQPWLKRKPGGRKPHFATGKIVMPKKVKLPADINDLAYYLLPDLASLIKNRKISSVELTKLFIDRLKKYGDTLECIITLTEGIAMEQAKKADSLLSKGVYLGMLHGIPYGLKDLFSVKGTKTTWGAEPYKNQVIDEDAYVYQRLRNAGAILIAKLSLGALAQGDVWFGGRTRSPWNLSRGSSGSSAGSASATVAGLVPFAIGTETLGSIVSPSTACGATGLRPTFGSVSRTGAMTLCWSLDKIGPICRSAEDAAIVFTYINGFDDFDGVPAPEPYRYNSTTEVKKLRVAYAKNYFDQLDSTRNEWAVLEAFRKMGVEPEPMTFPDDSLVWPFDITSIVLGSESAAAFDLFTRSNVDDLMTRQYRGDWPNYFRTARFIPAVDYINANRQRTLLMRTIQAAMEPYDVVITPTYAGHQLSITNLTGNPAVCMPNGFDKRSGMPTSVTFLGKLWGEAAILRAADAYQQATGWNSMRPPLFK